MKIKVIRTMKMEFTQAEFIALTNAAYCGIMTNRMVEHDQKLADDMLRQMNAQAEISLFPKNDETPF